MCLWAVAAFASPSNKVPSEPKAAGEIHHYRETTDSIVTDVTWQLTQDNGFVLTYSSPLDQYVTTTDPGYDTLRWQVTAENGLTDFTAERMDRSIWIKGVFKGRRIDKVLEIDGSRWYQSTSLSMRSLIASPETERTFWTIRLDTLTAHKIKAIKQGMDRIESDGGTQSLLKIRLTLPGLLASFWKSDYWFSMPDGVFFRFKGPNGPPGSPITTVTRTEH